jgi:hypothetical protein
MFSGAMGLKCDSSSGRMTFCFPVADRLKRIRRPNTAPKHAVKLQATIDQPAHRGCPSKLQESKHHFCPLAASFFSIMLAIMFILISTDYFFLPRPFFTVTSASFINASLFPIPLTVTRAASWALRGQDLSCSQL